MKKCSKCGEEKMLTEFHQKGKQGRYNSLCKKCFSQYCIARWTSRKIKAVENKGGKCAKCGYSRCLGALEFHHTDPSEKEFDWGKVRLQSEDKMFKELSKCVLLCANCHREEHELIRNSDPSNTTRLEDRETNS